MSVCEYMPVSEYGMAEHRTAKIIAAAAQRLALDFRRRLCTALARARAPARRPPARRPPDCATRWRPARATLGSRGTGARRRHRRLAPRQAALVPTAPDSTALGRKKRAFTRPSLKKLKTASKPFDQAPLRVGRGSSKLWPRQQHARKRPSK